MNAVRWIVIADSGMINVNQECFACLDQTLLVHAQGITIFRMQRNEEFLKSMLHFVSKFYTSYVQPGILPPVNMLFDTPGYCAFLHLALKIARETPEVMHIAHPALAKGSDMRTFLS